MGNGTEQTVWASIDDLRVDIKELIRNGCAKREGDLKRMETIEDIVSSHNKKLDKIYYTSLVTAGGIIAFLIKAFFSIMAGK